MANDVRREIVSLLLKIFSIWSASKRMDSGYKAALDMIVAMVNTCLQISFGSLQQRDKLYTVDASGLSTSLFRILRMLQAVHLLHDQRIRGKYSNQPFPGENDQVQQ